MFKPSLKQQVLTLLLAVVYCFMVACNDTPTGGKESSSPISGTAKSRSTVIQTTTEEHIRSLAALTGTIHNAEMDSAIAILSDNRIDIAARRTKVYWKMINDLASISTLAPSTVVSMVQGATGMTALSFTQGTPPTLWSFSNIIQPYSLEYYCQQVSVIVNNQPLSNFISSFNNIRIDAQAHLSGDDFMVVNSLIDICISSTTYWTNPSNPVSGGAVANKVKDVVKADCEWGLTGAMWGATGGASFAGVGAGVGALGGGMFGAVVGSAWQTAWSFW